MSRHPFIAGNWKLNLGPQEAARVAKDLVAAIADRGDVTVALFPTALSVPAVLDAAAGSDIGIGVQEIEAVAKGAFTGGNSAEMARAMGCTYALVGHSERRQLWGETDARCAAKVKHALEAGLLPILCIGETLEQRKAGQVDAVVTGQLEAGHVIITPVQELAPGPYTLQVDQDTFAIEVDGPVDTTPPLPPTVDNVVHSADDDWGYAQDLTEIRLSSVPSGSHVEVELTPTDGGAALIAAIDERVFSVGYDACGATWPGTFTGSADYTLRIRAVDAAGHPSSWMPLLVRESDADDEAASAGCTTVAPPSPWSWLRRR